MASHSWHELLTSAAAAIVWIVGGVLVALSLRRRSGGSRRRGRAITRPVDEERRVVAILGVLVAALSFGAAAIHLAAAPDHVEELGALGFGFYLAAAFQAAWAVAWLLRAARRLGWIGVAGNAAISAAWVGSRVIGLPSGPTPWQPEAVGTPDTISTVFQLVIVALLVARFAGADARLLRSVRSAASAATIGIVPIVGIVFLVATIGVSTAIAGDHHGGASGAGAGASHDVAPAADAHAQGGHTAP
jgi:hypothetical protein